MLTAISMQLALAQTRPLPLEGGEVRQSFHGNPDAAKQGEKRRHQDIYISRSEAKPTIS